MIFSTIYFSILKHFTDNGWFDTPVGMLLNKLRNPSIYSIWNIQAHSFGSDPYLKCFGTLEFEMDKLY